MARLGFWLQSSWLLIRVLENSTLLRPVRILDQKSVKDKSGKFTLSWYETGLKVQVILSACWLALSSQPCYGWNCESIQNPYNFQFEFSNMWHGFDMSHRWNRFDRPKPLYMQPETKGCAAWKLGEVSLVGWLDFLWLCFGVFWIGAWTYVCFLGHFWFHRLWAQPTNNIRAAGPQPKPSNSNRPRREIVSGASCCWWPSKCAGTCCWWKRSRWRRAAASAAADGAAASAAARAVSAAAADGTAAAADDAAAVRGGQKSWPWYRTGDGSVGEAPVREDVARGQKEETSLVAFQTPVALRPVENTPFTRQNDENSQKNGMDDKVPPDPRGPPVSYGRLLYHRFLRYHCSLLSRFSSSMARAWDLLFYLLEGIMGLVVKFLEYKVFFKDFFQGLIIFSSFMNSGNVKPNGALAWNPWSSKCDLNWERHKQRISDLGMNLVRWKETCLGMEGQRTNQCQMMDINSCLHVLISYLKHAAELQQSRVLGVVEASGINRVLKLSKEQGAAARQDRIKDEGAAARQDRSKEEGPAGRQVVSEEDGTRVQQESNEVPSSQAIWSDDVLARDHRHVSAFEEWWVHSEPNTYRPRWWILLRGAGKMVLIQNHSPHIYTWGPGDQRQSNGRVEVNGSKLRSEEYSMQLVLHLLFCLLQLATSMTAFAWSSLEKSTTAKLHVSSSGPKAFLEGERVASYTGACTLHCTILGSSWTLDTKRRWKLLIDKDGDAQSCRASQRWRLDWTGRWMGANRDQKKNQRQGHFQPSGFDFWRGFKGGWEGRWRREGSSGQKDWSGDLRSTRWRWSAHGPCHLGLRRPDQRDDLQQSSGRGPSDQGRVSAWSEEKFGSMDPTYQGWAGVAFPKEGSFETDQSRRSSKVGCQWLAGGPAQQAGLHCETLRGIKIWQAKGQTGGLRKLCWAFWI